MVVVTVRTRGFSRGYPTFSCRTTGFRTWRVQGMEGLVAQESLNKSKVHIARVLSFSSYLVSFSRKKTHHLFPL